PSPSDTGVSTVSEPTGKVTDDAATLLVGLATSRCSLVALAVTVPVTTPLASAVAIVLVSWVVSGSSILLSPHEPRTRGNDTVSAVRTWRRHIISVSRMRLGVKA